MTTSAREAGYSTPARWLHWLTALCVFILVPVAVAMTNLGEGALTNALYEVHKSVGMIAFAIVAMRLAYRLFGRRSYERALRRLHPEPEKSMERGRR